MNWESYRFFKLNGSLLSLGVQRLNKIKEFNQKVVDFLSNFDTDKYLRRGDKIVAVFKVKEQIPEGWKNHPDNDEYIVPDKRKTLGKKAAKELNSLATPDADEIIAAIGCNSTYITSSSVTGATFVRPTHFTINESHFIAIHKDDSEYSVTAEMEEVPAWEIMKAYTTN